MYINTIDTPNPNSLKFLFNDYNFDLDKGVDIDNIEEAKLKSPLIYDIFNIKNIKSVFITKDFITVTKENDIKWELIKNEIIAVIIDFISSGKKIFNDAIDINANNKSEHNIDNNISNADKDIINQIIELIDNRIRPAVAMDGGDIIFHSFIDGVVKLELKGACSSCPSSTITLKNGVENMLKHYIPEVKLVEAINDFSDE